MFVAVVVVVVVIVSHSLPFHPLTALPASASGLGSMFFSQGDI